MVSAPTGTAEVAALSGAVHGGQQPVTGALVSLIAPGTTGYGSAGSVIVTTTTDLNGNFTLPRPYTCPANSGLVYLLATGGNAGAGPNPSIAEAAIVGPCSALTANTYVSISEVTTVAAAYALAPFATVSTLGTSIGTSATNLQGLTNAAGAAGNLANITTGAAHVTGDFAGIVPPTSELNTIADILSTCVNQGTTLGVPTSCASLFSDTTPSGGVAPVDTFQAAINLAKNPALNNTALFNLVTANAPFQPTLSKAPGDFTVALGFNGGAINQNGGTICVVIDAAGNAWITTGYPGTATHVLTEISPTGSYLSGATVSPTTGFGSSVLNSPVGLVIDGSGNLIVANNGANDVVKLSPSGSLLSTFSSSSIAGPNGISIDGNGNTWVANFGSATNLTTEITPTFTEATHSPVTTNFGNVDIAAGPAAVWVTSHTQKVVSRIDLGTFAVTNAQLNDATAGVAIDHNNNAWVADISTGNLFEITNAGVITGPPGGFVYPNGGVQCVAIDGLGNIFGGGYLFDNTLMGALVEYNSSGTYLATPNGFYGSNVIPNLPQIDGIAIDGSGNVWIAGTNTGTNLPAYVAEVVGVAAPVVTPHITAVVNNQLGVRP
jgi:streptogramin lyase